jgi:hypothetical protein
MFDCASLVEEFDFDDLDDLPEYPGARLPVLDEDENDDADDIPVGLELNFD